MSRKINDFKIKNEEAVSGKKIKRLKVASFPLMLAIINKLELRSIFSKHFKQHRNQKISTIDTLIIILFNIITGRQPMYELSNWVTDIHPQCFGFEEFDVSIFNDDRFGRAIDKIYNAERSTIMTEIVLNAIDKFKINLEEIHNDSTTIKAFGKIPGKTKAGLELKKGNSKDHRPDLKQLVYTLSISADGAVPIHYKTYSGNRTDDTTHIESWNALRQIVGKSDFLYIADSKVCTDKQLNYITKYHGRVITIIPETWSEVNDFKNELRKHTKAKKEIMRKPIPGTLNEEMEYFFKFSGNYYTKKRGYNIHWIFSTEKKKRDFLSREKALRKAERALTDLLPKTNKGKLKTKEEIEKKYKKILSEAGVSKFYHISIDEVQEEDIAQIGRGRPGPDTKYTRCVNTIYSVSWTRKKLELQKEKKVDGIFPLLSTYPNLTSRETLKAYKYQPRLEKRFEHLKRVLLAAPLLYKKIERVEGIMFLFFIGLMVQALIEREVRYSMKNEDIEKLFIYPEYRPATAPTTSVILDRFEDVSIYHLMNNEKTIEKFKDDLNDTQKEILQLLKISPDEYWPKIL